MPTRRGLFVFNLLIALCAPALASDHDAFDIDYDGRKRLIFPSYLNRRSLRPLTLVPPAPLPGSDADQADFERIFYLQATRTEADCVRARSIEPAKPEPFFGPEYGPLTQAEIDLTKGFLRRFRSDVAYFTWRVKRHYDRPRPHDSNPDVHPCVEEKRTNAYPSGHSSLAQAWALTLAEIFPEKRDALLARAEQIKNDRVLGGVHHPSDTQAGAQLGERVFRALMNRARFQRDLQATRELRYRALPPAGQR